MTYVVILLWLCGGASLVLIPLLVRELATPVDPDVAALARRDRAHDALRRINSRHMTAVPTSRGATGPARHTVEGKHLTTSGRSPSLRAAASTEPATHTPRAHAGTPTTTIPRGGSTVVVGRFGRA